jgi:hypothetical protein
MPGRWSDRIPKRDRGISSDSSFPVPNPFSIALGTGTVAREFCSLRSAALSGSLASDQPGPGLRWTNAVASTEGRRPPRFLGDLCARAPLSDPGGSASPWPVRGDGVAFRTVNDVGARELTFGAPSRGPCARCLRFTTTVTRRRARLASGWGPALARQDFTCKVPLQGFCAGFYIASPLPRLRLAH